MAVQQSCRAHYKLPRESRIKTAKLFRETFEQGRRIAGSLMVMRVRTGTNEPLRLAVAAGRKAVGGAVARNFAKRRLREALRLNRHRLKDGCNLVLLARPGILTSPWQKVQSELIILAGRAGILKGETPDVRPQTSDLKTKDQKSDV